MTLNELLNSDVKALVGEARRAFDWWIDELASLVPRSMRGWNTSKANIIYFEDDGRFTPADTLDAQQATSRNSVILFREGAVLCREVATPAMTRADLQRVLTLNSERYFPLPGGSVLLANAIRPDRRDDGMMQTDVAAVPLVRAHALGEALQAEGIEVRSIGVETRDATPDPRFDFLPAMRNAGLLPAPSANRRNWWILVAVFALLNVATLVWRDAADLDRLQALADAQRPAVGVARRITAQIRTLNNVAHGAAVRRGQREPLAILAETTAAVPSGAWVQRYASDGATLRLTGYRTRDTDVAAALRRTNRFANVKSAQTDSIAETATGQPFDLAAEIRAR